LVFSYAFNSGTDVVPEVVDDEVGRTERHLLLALDRIRRRAALHVDGSVLHQRNAVGRGDRLQVDLEIGQLEVGLDRIDDLHAQVHRIADGLLLVVEVGERDRRLTVTDRDGAGLLDLLQRAGEFLRLGGQGDAGDDRGNDGSNDGAGMLHRKILL
jgi:hypothetical protein